LAYVLAVSYQAINVWGLHRMGNVESAASALICKWLNQAVRAGQLKGDAAHYRFSSRA
jgi:hypothetical protein